MPSYLRYSFPKQIVFHCIFTISAIAFSGYVYGENGSSQEEKKNHFCLTMVVKNDEDLIQGCLDRVQNVIDCVSICDAGSTDRTVQIIEEFMEKSGIPGVIYYPENDEFASDQSYALECAQQTLEQLGISLSGAYLVVIDPSMKVEVDPSFKKDLLKEDAYLVLETSTALSYSRYNIRILRASLPWKQDDLISDSWSCTEVYSQGRLDNLKVVDEKNGTARNDQLQRNVALSQRALEVNPHNEKALFQLAQSYKGMERYQDAIHYYEKKIKNSHNKEEIWFAQFMIGECYSALDLWDRALYWYLEAYQTSPSRPETLQKVATHYRVRGENELTYLFAKYGMQIPYPNEGTLFNEPPLYKYQFDEEISISAFYTKHKDDGLLAANEVVLRRNVPWSTKYQAYQNLLFYVKPLQGMKFYPIDIKTPLIRKGYSERYHPTNPSILKTKDGYKLICRTVNYNQTDAKYFSTIDEFNIFRTRNFLIEYDKNFKVLSQVEMIETLPRQQYRVHALDGLDDCRLFEFNGGYWFTCTSTDTSPVHTFEISLCKLGDEQNEEIIFIESLVPLKGPDPYRCEKNWIPFQHNGRLYTIYSYDPFIIYAPNLETGQCETVFQYQPKHDFTHFRGSAGLIDFDDGYLMIIHEVVQLPDQRRRYLHRFVYLNRGFVIEKVSTPFVFRHLGIEFCCGMTLDHSESQLVLSVGIEDREAYLGMIDIDLVRSMLAPLPLE